MIPRLHLIAHEAVHPGAGSIEDHGAAGQLRPAHSGEAVTYPARQPDTGFAMNFGKHTDTEERPVA